MQIPETEIIVTKDGAEILRQTVRPGDYVIGREPGCEVQLDVELVSWRHAQLTVNFDHALIEDLGSSNGTFVNGQRVTEPTRLWPNQKIQIGAASMELRRLKSAPPLDASLAPQTAAVQRLLPEELLRDRKYDIGKVVAQGGMGAILDAKDAITERRVAMKVMLDGSSPEDLARFVAEAKVTAQLEHPSIVPIYELSVDENGQPFYTMKMVRGITLRKVLELLAEGVPEAVKKYPLPALLTIFQKVCDALAFAHSKGVIHRDLKPENIMLDDFGVVLVMDWGLAKVLGGHWSLNAPAPGADRAAPSIIRTLPLEASGATLAGSIMGTPQYMSPEQARGEVEDLDARSDIYALGAILYHILALRPPVRGHSAMEVVDKVGRGEIEPLVVGRVSSRAKGAPAGGDTRPTTRLPGGSVPEGLAAVVRKAMAFDKAPRYGSVEKLQHDLIAYQTGFATSAENAGFAKQLILALKRHKAVTASIAAALFVLAAVVAGFTIKVVGEKNRAERALADLQKTVPTLIAEGRKLIDAQQFDDALAKISFAVQIEPRNTGHRLLRAQLLQAMLRLDESAAEFRRVLSLDSSAAVQDSARANLALCEILLHDYPGIDAFDRAAWQKLYTQMDKEGRSSQAAPIMTKLGLARDATEALLKVRLVDWRKLPGWDKKPEKEHVQWENDGTLYLNFDNVPLSDLSAVQGLPVSRLSLQNAPITDLSPLRGMRLRDLVIGGIKNLTDLSVLRGMPLKNLSAGFVYQLADISPLHGLPLTIVNLTGTRVTDFSPLKGSPITVLSVGNSPVTSLESLKGLPVTKLNVWSRNVVDISAVRTMPLRSVALDGDWGKPMQLRDFTPLLECAALEEAFLPRDIREIEVLKKHRGLRQLAFAEAKLKPAAEFWAEFDTIWKARDEDAAVMTKLRSAFAAAGLPNPDQNVIVRMPEGNYELRFSSLGSKVKVIPDVRGLPIATMGFSGNPITDLAPLVGVPIRELHLWGVSVHDFTVLQKCPQLETLFLSENRSLRDISTLAGLRLRQLDLNKTAVSDLAALAGMSLKALSCSDTRVRDLTPLRACQELDSLIVEDTSSLRDLAPLAGMKLHTLCLSRTSVADLSPLSGMPLRDLRLSGTKVTDLRPLLECAELETLLLPEGATNIGELRALKKLRRLSMRWNDDGPAQTAEQFWKEYDAKKGGGK